MNNLTKRISVPEELNEEQAERISTTGRYIDNSKIVFENGKLLYKKIDTDNY